MGGCSHFSSLIQIAPGSDLDKLDLLGKSMLLRKLIYIFLEIRKILETFSFLSSENFPHTASMLLLKADFLVRTFFDPDFERWQRISFLLLSQNSRCI